MDNVHDGGNVKENKKVMTDAQLQKKSVKLVVLHLKKKIDPDAAGIDRVCAWIDRMEELLAQDGFDRTQYLDMKKQLFDATEWVFDVDLRHKLRNSWYSFGKAMDKKVPKY